MNGTKIGVAFVLSVGFAWAGFVAQYLSEMDQATRENAVIILDWAGAHTDEMLHAEYLWNTGRYDEAISAIEALELEYGDMCIGVSWRKPIETEGPKWGTDVRVTPIPNNVVDIELVKAAGNNNLFIAARGDTAGLYQWWLYISTNGGASWAMADSWASTAPFTDVDIAELGDGYIYLAYSNMRVEPKVVKMVRFNETTGAFDNSYDFFDAAFANDTISEIKLEPYRGSVQQLYLLFLDKSHNLYYFWGTNGGTTWYDASPGVTDARSGIDMDFGSMSGSQHYLWISWINTSGYLRAAGRVSGSWKFYTPIYSVNVAFGTKIAQHGDTVIILDSDIYAGYLEYFITFDDGNTWGYGIIYDSTQAGAFDVTGRGNQGWHVSFCNYNQSGNSIMKYRKRPYSGNWGNVVSFGDRNAFFSYHSSIDYIGAGAYGVAYIDYLRIVWFDRSDWTDIAESSFRPLPMDFRAIPGAGRTTLSFVLPEAGFASLKIYDARGALVNDLSGNYAAGPNRVEFVPDKSGSYFVLLSTGKESVRAGFVVVK